VQSLPPVEAADFLFARRPPTRIYAVDRSIVHSARIRLTTSTTPQASHSCRCTLIQIKLCQCHVNHPASLVRMIAAAAMFVVLLPMNAARGTGLGKLFPCMPQPAKRRKNLASSQRSILFAKIYTHAHLNTPHCSLFSTRLMIILAGRTSPTPPRQ
jgi:hypothetical protein